MKTAVGVPVSSPWSGGGSPFAINSKKFGMWLFLVSDTLTFAALILAYTYLRLANPDWPRPFEFSPAIVNATVMTVILLASSLTMVLAVAAAHANDRAKAARYVIFTACGGILFGITGMHMTHVTIGVIYLLVIAVGLKRGKFTADDVEVSGLYWHFVDLVW